MTEQTKSITAVLWNGKDKFLKFTISKNENGNMVVDETKNAFFMAPEGHVFMAKLLNHPEMVAMCEEYAVSENGFMLLTEIAYYELTNSDSSVFTHESQFELIRSGGIYKILAEMAQDADNLRNSSDFAVDAIAEQRPAFHEIMNQLTGYKYNWDGNNAQPVSMLVIQQLTELFNGNIIDFTTVFVDPTPSGGVKMEWTADEFLSILQIEEDMTELHLSSMYDRNIRKITYNSVTDLLTTFKEYMKG